MKLKKLCLKNYRNYEEFEYNFSNNKTLIIGKNAQGKTNILESIYYLCALDSNRIKKDSELITFNKDLAQIKAEITKNDIDLDLEVILNPPKNKMYIFSPKFELDYFLEIEIKTPIFLF